MQLRIFESRLCVGMRNFNVLKYSVISSLQVGTVFLFFFGGGGRYNLLLMEFSVIRSLEQI